MRIRIVSSRDIGCLISMGKAIECMRKVFSEISEKQVIIPPREVIELKARKNEKNALVIIMPAYLLKDNYFGVKVGSLVPNNHMRSLPLINGIMILLDSFTGQPKALMDGAALTSLRTGAASGLATDLLARQDSSSLAIIGAGVQARTQLEAVCCVRPIKEVRIYSRTRQKAEDFAIEITSRAGFPSQVLVCDILSEATRDADIVCSATTSKTPIYDLKDIKASAHINAVGGHTLTSREASTKLLKVARVAVEQREASLRESCERNVIELGEIINNLCIGRESNNQITLFASVGIAAQDVAIAEKILCAAEDEGIGSFIDF